MMKKFLGHKKAKGIGLRDLFPQEKMAEVNQLNKIGNFLRMEKVITKYRVINIGNAPVIQVIYEDGKFYTTMEQEKIDEILKIMPEDDEMEQDSQQQSSQQDSQQNDTEQQQQAPLVLYSGGGAKLKKPTSNNETGDIRGEETGGRGGSSRSGSGQEEGAVGGAFGGAGGGGSGGGRGGRSSGKSSRNASSSRGRSGSGASSGKKPEKSNSDSDKASYAQKAATRGGLANRTKKPEESRIMRMFLARKLGASGKD